MNKNEHLFNLKNISYFRRRQKLYADSLDSFAKQTRQSSAKEVIVEPVMDEKAKFFEFKAKVISFSTKFQSKTDYGTIIYKRHHKTYDIGKEFMFPLEVYWARAIRTANNQAYQLSLLFREKHPGSALKILYPLITMDSLSSERYRELKKKYPNSITPFPPESQN